jgi:hypothetical protein
MSPPRARAPPRSRYPLTTIFLKMVSDFTNIRVDEADGRCYRGCYRLKNLSELILKSVEKRIIQNGRF